MKTIMKVRRFTPIAVLCSMAAAGCDSRELLGPATRTVSPRASVDAPASLGSGFVPAPPNTSPAAVASPPYAQLASFPESTWVVVNVAGNVQLAWNDEPCRQRAIDAPFWPCQDGSPLSVFGSEPWDGGPLSLQATFGDGGNGAVKLRGSGGSGEGGGSAVGLFYASQSGSLSGHVNMTAQWAWDPTFGNGPYSYNVSGGYTVTATAVPSPFEVTESAPDASGVVTYTVEPLYGLQLTAPVNGWPDGATFWAFYPGDSLPDRPDLGWPGWTISECQFKLVCRYNPPQQGRVQVLAHLERQSAYARSKPAGGQCQHSSTPFGARASVSGSGCAQEPKLVLRCDGRSGTDSVMRGNRMNCTVSADSAGATLTDIKWQFQDEQGHTIPGPSGDTKEWGGIMVVGGQMQATATLNGKPASASIEVTGTARDWSGKITFPPEPEPEWVSGPPLTYPPIIEGDTLADGTLGKSTWPRPEAASGFGEGTGPNDGWYFFDQPPYFSPNQSHIYLNNALKPTDPFWRAQRGPPPNQVVMGKPGCGPDFMRHAARHVPAHEHGHYSRAESLTKSPQGAALLESAVHWGDPVTDEEKDEMIQNWLREDRAQQAHWDSVSVLHVPCEFTRP